MSIGYLTPRITYSSCLCCCLHALAACRQVIKTCMCGAPHAHCSKYASDDAGVRRLHACPQLLRCLGPSLVEFLSNLDRLHLHLVREHAHDHRP